MPNLATGPIIRNNSATVGHRNSKRKPQQKWSLLKNKTKFGLKFVQKFVQSGLPKAGPMLLVQKASLVCRAQLARCGRLSSSTSAPGDRSRRWCWHRRPWPAFLRRWRAGVCQVGHVLQCSPCVVLDLVVDLLLTLGRGTVVSLVCNNRDPKPSE